MWDFPGGTAVQRFLYGGSRQGVEGFQNRSYPGRCRFAFKFIKYVWVPVAVANDQEGFL